MLALLGLYAYLLGIMLLCYGVAWCGVRAVYGVQWVWDACRTKREAARFVETMWPNIAAALATRSTCPVCSGTGTLHTVPEHV